MPTMGSQAPTMAFSDPWRLLWQEDGSWSIRTRARAGAFDAAFEQSYEEGVNTWTPRMHFFPSQSVGSYFTNDYAALVDPGDPAVAATGYSPFSVSGGVLTVRAQPKPVSLASVTLPNRRTTGPVDTGVELPWVSGYLTTRNSIWFGRTFKVEADVWVTKGQASFPTGFWLYNREDYGGNEIDIHEFQGQRPTWSNWALHGQSSDSDWSDRGLGDLSTGYQRYGFVMENGVCRWLINEVEIGSARPDPSLLRAQWFIIIDQCMLNWEDNSGPDFGASPYPTQNPTDLRIGNVRVYVKKASTYGGSLTPALSGSTAWVAGSVNSVAPTVHVKPGVDVCYAAGGLRHQGHCLVRQGAYQRGVGSLYGAVGAASGTIVVKVTVPSGAHASTDGSIIGAWDWDWIGVPSGGTTVQMHTASSQVTVSGFTAGKLTIVRSWDASITKGCINGGAVASVAQGNVGYTGEHLGIGGDYNDGRLFAGTVDEIIYYPHSSALSDAAMQAIT